MISIIKRVHCVLLYSTVIDTVRKVDSVKMQETSQLIFWNNFLSEFCIAHPKRVIQCLHWFQLVFDRIFYLNH